MEASGHLAAPATLYPRKEPPVPIEDEHIYIYIRGLLEKYPTVFCYANT